MELSPCLTTKLSTPDYTDLEPRPANNGTWAYGKASDRGRVYVKVNLIMTPLEQHPISEALSPVYAWFQSRSCRIGSGKVLESVEVGWILDQPAFFRWLSPDFPKGTAKLLWIHGPAGFGKTILCARVVEHLSSTLETPVAHFFFSSDLESRGDPFAAIRSWISQVMSRDQAAFDLVRGRWEAQQEQVATRATVVKLIRELLQAVPGCTLVADGLDECTELENSSVSVATFLETVKKAAADTTTRILIVSRGMPEIQHVLMDNTRAGFVEYKISPEDVRADTASYSKSIVYRKLFNMSEAIKSEISGRMADRCEGQFLSKSKKQLEDAIAKTPVGLERLYDRNWEKITGLEEEDKTRATSLLRWAAFALRLLTVCEITEAVLIHEDCDDFPLDKLPDSEKIDPLKKSFRDCAAGLWYRHANLGISNNADVIRLTNVLFDRTNTNWDSWRQWFDSDDEELKKAEPVNKTSPPSPLYYILKLELTGTAIYLIQECKYDTDKKSSSGRIALRASCTNGNVTIVKILLDAEANVTVAAKNGVVPLYGASLNGHVEVVKLLLEKEADVAVTTKNG
ncbi:hypothetical protein BKA56DRAFT_658440 [Ilyonectria sp. MPI-CAGE-AT-0026]|nr:hypothetical protein BKA56DRAFT_658440 [Ilyonectria sp. MPI-CAGE-AT-0026]